MKCLEHYSRLSRKINMFQTYFGMLLTTRRAGTSDVDAALMKI